MKTFTQYFKSLTLLATMLLGTMNVWGAEANLESTSTSKDQTARERTFKANVSDDVEFTVKYPKYYYEKPIVGNVKQYYYLDANTNATITWSVPSGYTIVISSVTVNANAQGSNKGWDIYTSVSTSSTKSSKSGSSFQNNTINTDEYLKNIGNNGTITLQHGNTEMQIKTISITYTLVQNPDIRVTNVDLVNEWSKEIALADVAESLNGAGELIVGATSDAEVATYDAVNKKFVVGHKTGVASFEVSTATVAAKTLTITVKSPYYIYAQGIVNASAGCGYTNSDDLAALAATKNQAEAETVLANMRSKVKAYLAANEPASADITFMLDNADFQYDEWNYGWSGTTNDNQNGDGDAMVAFQKNTDNSNVYAWNNRKNSGLSSRTLEACDVYQNKSVLLPKGAYRLTADVEVSSNDDNAGFSATLYAKNGETLIESTKRNSVEDGTFQNEVVNFILAEETPVVFGLSNTEVKNSSRKTVKVDNFRLQYIGRLATHIEWVGTTEFEADQEVTNPFRVVDENGDVVADAVVTMASSNSNIVAISDDGRSSFHTYSGGAVILTASYAGDATHLAAENKTQEITVPLCEGTIVWNETYRSFGEEDVEARTVRTLTPAFLDKNGVQIEGVAFTFASANPAVATVEGNQLTIAGLGRTTITATTPANVTDIRGAQYTPAQMVKEVVVRRADEPCSESLSVFGGTQKMDGGTKDWTWSNPTGDLVDVTGETNVRFTASISALAVRATFNTYQRVGDAWIEVANSDKPAAGSSAVVTCQVAANATGLRVEYSGTGWGSCTVSDVFVSMASYLRPSDAEASFSGTATQYVEWNSGDVTVQYCNIPTIQYEITNLSPAGETFTIVPATIDNVCGEYGTYTFALKGTFTQVGTVTANLHLYTATDAVGINIPISLTVDAPAVRTYDGEAWDVAPTEFDAVVIAGNLDVNSPLTVAAMSIDEGVSVTVSDQLTLLHSDAAAAATAGNLVVKDGGKVQVDGSGVLTVNDLVIKTTQATSGQLVAEAERLKVLGGAYLDMQLSDGAITAGWYDFALPFDVDVESGIYRMTAEGPVKMQYATDYYISAYSEAARAQNLSGWSYYDAGTMQAGYQYMIYMLNTTNSTLRFRALYKERIISTDDVDVSFSIGEEVYRGWNVIGNNTLACAAPDLEEGVKVQVYKREDNCYSTVGVAELMSYIGSSFAVQVPSSGSVSFVPASVAAPARGSYGQQAELCIRLYREGEADYLDQVFMSANTYALDSYEIGHDLLKMGAPTSARVAQIWTSAYGYKLCDVELPLVQNVADFPLYLYSPCADAYSLSAIVPNGTQVYLMQNGMPVWDMSMGDYPLDLTKSEHAQYSIRMVYGAKVPTSVDETVEKSAAQKIFVDGQLYIVKNGTIFDVNGKRVK